MTDLVSVIIPTRDRRPMLERTLATVFWQTHVELEVLVVDDGSADDTAAFVDGLADDRVRLLRQASSGGVAAARNRGVAEATGTYVAFLDDDDLWAPEKIAAQVAALRTAPAATWCYPSAVIVDERLRPVKWQPAPAPEGLTARLLQVNVVPGGASSVVARRSAVVDAGGFDASLATFADRDLWIRLSRAGAAMAVDRVLMAYVRHGGSMTGDIEGKRRELAALEQKHRALRVELGADPPEVAVLHSIGETAWRAGDRRAARRAYAAAARLPRNRFSRLRWALTHVPGFMGLYDTVKRLRVPADARRDAEQWLRLLRAG